MAEEKKKMKARIIQEYLPRCSRYKCYTQGEIPMSKFEKARESYASGVSYRDVLGMIDESFFGDGSKGFLFTEEGYYTKGSDGCIRYRYHPQYGRLLGYNTPVLDEMLDKLYQVNGDGVSGGEVAEVALKLASAFLDAWLDG